ncbi:hypothetical protein IEQ34_011610 [Dendrobium chrysotoxum]|uniref:Uncharacterized protein n=1 Tax=Dendrobium chrysotoxum TaxID=161865 RepID=A0AAV7GS37_DENCH|nr:hypothetical protein IEQ34_011610 [Dendrobium chrysotoxum]
METVEKEISILLSERNGRPMDGKIIFGWKKSVQHYLIVLLLLLDINERNNPEAIEQSCQRIILAKHECLK